MRQTPFNEFEQFLQAHTEELRMRPSSATWKKIDERLHRRKRTYLLAGILVLLLGSALLLTLPAKQTTTPQALADNNTPADNRLPASAANNPAGNPVSQPLATPAQNITGNGVNQSATGNNRYPVAPATSALTAESENSSQTAIFARNTYSSRSYRNTRGSEAIYTAATPVNENNETKRPATARRQPLPVTPVTAEPAITIAEEKTIGNTPAENNGKQSSFFTNAPQQSLAGEPGSAETENKLTAGLANAAEKIAAPQNPGKKEEINKPALAKKENADKNADLAESIKLRRRSRFSTEFYATPYISYRKLTDSRDKNLSYAYSHEELDEVIEHKPSLGLEAGVSWHYRVYDRLRIKAGVQVNYSPYRMRAVRTPAPEAVSISLYGREEDINTYSQYRTQGKSGDPVWLNNKSLQVSVPIGFEATLSSSPSGRTSLNLGATAQPTYMAIREIPLLSTDLKNYTTEPSLVRRFNLNVGIQPFFSYTSQKMRWHIGPSLRFQAFSTFDKSYPLRDHRLGYGFTVGVTKFK